MAVRVRFPLRVLQTKEFAEKSNSFLFIAEYFPHFYRKKFLFLQKMIKFVKRKLHTKIVSECKTVIFSGLAFIG